MRILSRHKRMRKKLQWSKAKRGRKRKATAPEQTQAKRIRKSEMEVAEEIIEVERGWGITALFSNFERARLLWQVTTGLSFDCRCHDGLDHSGCVGQIVANALKFQSNNHNLKVKPALAFRTLIVAQLPQASQEIWREFLP